MSSWQDVPCRLAPRKYTRHRSAWVAVYGPIPVGLFVCHRCDEPRCWEVRHLFLGTPKDNTQDALKKGRMILHAENLTRLHPNPGERNGRARLTEQDVQAIRQTPRAYGSGRQLAKQFGITPEMVSMIRHHKMWRHV